VGGLNVGADTTNLFQFTIPLPGGVAVGTVLTATATLGGSTSEFSNSVTVAAAPPDVSLVKSCPLPANCTTDPQQPGTDLTYQIVFSNNGGSPAQSFVIVDQIPSATDFKLGSVTTDLGSTGMTVAVVYSNDGGASYSYAPTDGGGGAPEAPSDGGESQPAEPAPPRQPAPRPPRQPAPAPTPPPSPGPGGGAAPGATR
jgi:uncharacterized repeat protein (TIGR01451 family)